MITAEFWPDKVCVSGHAGYAPKGQDIVCSAVSALYLTFQMALEALNPECLPCESDEDGTRSVSWGKPLSEAGIVLLTAFRMGIYSIAGSYPEYITIREYKPLH